MRLVKDLDADIAGRDILVAVDVVDTGLTMNYLADAAAARPGVGGDRHPARPPYRRLVDDLPVRYVGFTVPDELFVGYGFDLDERYRNLPDLHIRAA